MNWSTALDEAAERFDGGPPSFPLSVEANFASQYGYEPPNEDYEDLFRFGCAKMLQSQEEAGTCPHSAGWLIPSSESRLICKPVFVAHSTLAAIWLLRETLGKDALPGNSWERLTSAAQSLAEDTCESPGPADAFAYLEMNPSKQVPAHVASELYELLRDNDAPEAPPSAQVPSCPALSTGKRAASTAQESSPKRTCVVVEDTPSPIPLGPTSDDAAKQSQCLVTTVTNNNRRAELQRNKKLEVSRAKKRERLGLLAPGDKAAVRERAAYNSIALVDEPTIAWIIKQSISDELDFYNTSPTPYYTACTVLEKARTLGNHSSRYYAAQFLHTWREHGTPFRAGTGEQRLVRRSQLQQDVMSDLSQQANSDDAFCFAWDMCKRYETELAAVHIGARWALALLGDAYARKVQQIRQSDFAASNDRTRNRYGKGPVRTQAIEALRKLIYPSPSKKDFRSRLKQATRWHTLVQGLGWGSLLLIPHEEISNRWVERVLLVGQLNVFVALVRRERPDLVAASKALEVWLGPDGIAGGPISEKQTLSIEAEAPTTIYQVEDIQDSEDEETDEEVEISRPPESQDSTTPAVALRQMSLLELFHPVAVASLT